MSATIKKVKAREVLDSRGNPTTEVEVYSDNHYGDSYKFLVLLEGIFRK